MKVSIKDFILASVLLIQQFTRIRGFQLQSISTTRHHLLSSTLTSQQPVTSIVDNACPPLTRLSTKLFAKKVKKKSNKSSGGGFGGSSKATGSSTTPTISADKNSLETQWDIFASITDLEIKPKGDPEDDDYVNFEVADVFVRCGPPKEGEEPGTPWFRIGKVCTLPEKTPMQASLTLQKGLIFWTSVHMRPELVAAGGKSGAASLQLGVISPASLTMGTDSDGPLDEDEAEYIQVSVKGDTSLKDIPAKSFGFRPDWNPPGFTYKRREKDAMKKKKSSLDEMKEVSSA
mmetsp:Transcript_3084/g.7245  ORF Transcript_3084/g.7245 Transcript_3084/m.7245 type:complete len:289 (-) Transcript_3084:207-1073(-)|eukprot:CAMPEP_0113631580 /NCGR_PEP_ID=MMETSP0017_2-20120614/16411_1 /TAXON_ID=2856 /ORGANISM="Cylindrotheca closterium" /LENGTH=288 /DNA_ID=CAMNT_0000542095 /DNA_START=18 /DNA_END=884 /DNA_ORIENTATION=- /assembly_acc=CAM_ASM_000147